MPGFDIPASVVDFIYPILFIAGALLISELSFRLETWWITKKWRNIQLAILTEEGFELAYKQKKWSIYYNSESSNYILFNDNIGRVAYRRAGDRYFVIDENRTKIPSMPKKIKTMWRMILL